MFPLVIKASNVHVWLRTRLQVVMHNTTTVTPKYRKQDCYSPTDFRMGAYINVLNRDFMIHDADTFTKYWYKDNLGFADEELSAIELREPVTPLPRPALPPYNG